MAEGNQPKFVAQDIEGGGGGGDSGRGDTAAAAVGTSGSGGDTATHNGGQAEQAPPPPPPPATADNISLSSQKEASQKDAFHPTTGPAQHNPPKQPQVAGPNELFFGTGERTSGVSHRDREERLKHLREKQLVERQHKLEELKEHAASAQRFREQQEAQRRHRLQELRSRDHDRRSQVEERRRYMDQADQNRREQAFKKNVERDQRQETKRRNERSNIVFAFGSSTPRMLDPKENDSYWAGRRSTSISNVTLDSSLPASGRRSSDCVDTATTAAPGAPELARKRATSAQGLDRNPSDLRMSSSMYEVFHWTDTSPHTPQGGEDLAARSSSGSVARRRTDLHPITPSLRDAKTAASSSSSTHRSPGSSTTSRPSSAMSQASTAAAGGPVMLRARPAPRKPRPMSIAGSAPSTADRPRSPLGRDSRNALRNTSSGSIASVKSSRAKSVGGSDGSAPSTPARTIATAAAAPAPPPRTPRRTPQQVKAESNAKKAEKAKAATPKRATPKVTPLPSPTADGKAITGAPTKKTIIKKANGKTPDKSGHKEQTSTQQKQVTEVTSTTVTQTTTTKETALTTEAEAALAETVAIVENGIATNTLITETTETVVQSSNVASEVTEQRQVTEMSHNGHITSTETVTVTEAGQTATEEAATLQQTEETTITAITENGDGTAHLTGALETNTAPVPNDVNLEPASGAVVEAVTTADSATESTVATNAATSGDSRAVATEGSRTEVTSNGTAAADRPAAGYETEEQYKAVLAEKRRLAREAKERELEMQRLKEEEAAEKERREEEEMLKMMEEQRLAEQERLQKAIEQADRDREEESKRKEEEELQRIEAERLEVIRQQETEERLRREEEDRQSRKSRVAAIMARTRNKGGSTTPNKAESKTPSDDHRNISDVLQKANLTDSMIDKMSDSMIAAVTDLEAETCQTSSGVPSETASDFSSQPLSDASSQQPISDVSSHGTIENSSGTSSMEQTVRQDLFKPVIAGVDLITIGVAHVALQEQTNGNTTPDMDLLGSLNGHSNGVDNSNEQHQQQNSSVDLLGCFEPVTTNGSQQSAVITETTTEFEQIIDATQTKLNNEDTINSNQPPAPFIAFEQNLNNRTTPENNTSVPDILL